MMSELDLILGDLSNDPEYIAGRLALGVVEDALAIMEAQGMSTARLAAVMGVSSASVTRAFRIPSALTLRTIAQIGLAIGARPVVRLEIADETEGATK